MKNILFAVLVSVLILSGAPRVTNAASPGSLIRGASVNSVYYLGDDGKRYVFPNEKIFKSWYQNFDAVTTIPDAQLHAIPLGGNVTYKPGTRLIKITTDPKTYAVDKGGLLRWITSEEVAVALYGQDWAGKVDDVPDAFFVNYKIGSPVFSTSDFTPSDPSVPWSIMDDKKIGVVNAPQASPQTTSVALWKFDGVSWKPDGVPPACPALLLQSPVDLNKATSILYPGQYRGGNYKPHGGFRFDTSASSNITVVAPMDAYVYRGSRYIESGEVQYLLDFMTPCGFAYRFDHLLTLSPKYAAIVNQFPEPKVGDSRTTEFTPISVTTGETIATAVGLQNSPSTGVDWGVYDLRQMNSSAQDPAYKAQHADNTFAWHAICWFDLLSPADASKVRGLPAADGVSGKQSDYCK